MLDDAEASPLRGQRPDIRADRKVKSEVGKWAGNNEHKSN